LRDDLLVNSRTPHHSSQSGKHTPAQRRRPDAELQPAFCVQGLSAGDQHFSAIPLRKTNSCTFPRKTSCSLTPSVRQPMPQVDACPPMVSPVHPVPTSSGFLRPVATPFSGQVYDKRLPNPRALFRRPGSRGVQPLRTKLRTPLVGPSKAVEGGIAQSRGCTWLSKNHF